MFTVLLRLIYPRFDMIVLIALSCAAIRRDSVSLLKFPFLSQVQVFWCEMLLLLLLCATDILTLNALQLI